MKPIPPVYFYAKFDHNNTRITMKSDPFWELRLLLQQLGYWIVTKDQGENIAPAWYAYTMIYVIENGDIREYGKVTENVEDPGFRQLAIIDEKY